MRKLVMVEAFCNGVEGLLAAVDTREQGIT